jgi:hypothetical protein
MHRSFRHSYDVQVQRPSQGRGTKKETDAPAACLRRAAPRCANLARRGVALSTERSLTHGRPRRTHVVLLCLYLPRV